MPPLEVADVLGIIRCSRIGSDELRQFERLTRAGLKNVVFAVNSKDLDQLPVSKAKIVHVDEFAVENLGVFNYSADWPWRCGDLCLYLAKERFSDFKGFLLVEDDVYFSGSSLEHMLDLILRGDVEAAAARLKINDISQKYSRCLSDIGLNPRVGCIFPTVFATSRVIDCMLGLRLSADRAVIHPNDEAILASVVFENDFSYVDLEQALPEVFSRDSFDTNPPNLIEYLETQESCRAFHPAIDLKRIFDRIKDPDRRYGKHRLRRVMAQASEDDARLIKKLVTQFSKERRRMKDG